MPYSLIPLLLIIAGFLGTMMAADMTRDKKDAPTRFIGWVTFVCSVIMGALGALILVA